MTRQLNVLIACEESQAVCKEFRALGHRAFSCDIQDCSGGFPEWHIQGDVLPLLNGDCTFKTCDTHTHTGRALGFDSSSPALHVFNKLRHTRPQFENDTARKNQQQDKFED